MNLLHEKLFSDMEDEQFDSWAALETAFTVNRCLFVCYCNTHQGGHLMPLIALCVYITLRVTFVGLSDFDVIVGSNTKCSRQSHRMV